MLLCSEVFLKFGPFISFLLIVESETLEKWAEWKRMKKAPIHFSLGFQRDRINHNSAFNTTIIFFFSYLNLRHNTKKNGNTLSREFELCFRSFLPLSRWAKSPESFGRSLNLLWTCGDIERIRSSAGPWHYARKKRIDVTSIGDGLK